MSLTQILIGDFIAFLHFRTRATRASSSIPSPAPLSLEPQGLFVQPPVECLSGAWKYRQVCRCDSVDLVLSCTNYAAATSAAATVTHAVNLIRR